MWLGMHVTVEELASMGIVFVTVGQLDGVCVTELAEAATLCVVERGQAS